MPDINYNFEKGYDNLPKINVPINVFNYSFDLMDDNNLSSYSDFTPIYVTPDFENAESSVSDNNYFFDFGFNIINSYQIHCIWISAPFAPFDITFFLT